MTDPQPPNVVEGATTGDIDEEIPVAAKSAEDRKAQAALSSLDNKDDDATGGKNVDHDAVKKAMERLSGAGKGVNGTVAKKEEGEKVVKKTVKVDPADVTLLVCLVWESRLQCIPPAGRCIGQLLSSISALMKFSLYWSHIGHWLMKSTTDRRTRITENQSDGPAKVTRRRCSESDASVHSPSGLKVE